MQQEKQEKMASTQRRSANTEMVQHIWDAIVSIRQQKQVPNYERIANYIRRKHPNDMSQLEKQLDLAVADKLLVMTKTVGCKGSKVGVEQEAYRIPQGDIKRDGHDWYCFECHKEGEVICCTTCYRVYHKTCLKEEVSEKKFVCNFCQAFKAKDGIKFKKDELNMLLSYTCLRLKDKVLLCQELLKMPVVEEAWRHDYLLYEKMDLLTMEEKTQDNAYKCLEEFQADTQTIVHNIVLYYGVLSPLADIARTMLRDCCYELGEIKQCRDCYQMSNEKAEKFWFCKPCNPPHDLVFAKQKGFPYWPAKLINIGPDNLYDVRFFGGHHPRAKIDKASIKPITINLQQLQLKRTVSLNKALDELRRHQQLLGQTPIKATITKPTKKARSRPASSSSSRSGSESRSGKGSPSTSSEEISENEADNTSRDECPTSSSPKVPRFKVRPRDAPTPEDHNVVSSSSQESPNPKVHVSTQTTKKLLASLIPKPDKVVEVKETTPCDCEAKYTKMFKEFKERIEKEHREDKERSLRDLADRLRKEFEAEKQKLVSSALEKLQQEVDETKRKAEEELRQTQQMELNELVERQKIEISETKKKQWCYNCEAEAIYHCCWNTSYCSVECQQVHWHKEHKRTCRRKR